MPREVDLDGNTLSGSFVGKSFSVVKLHLLCLIIDLHYEVLYEVVSDDAVKVLAQS
jgi:hypothetical protein